MTSTVERVEAGLERGFRGPAWHGPSLSEVLLRLAPEQATARPVAGGHSIAELVRHVAAWKRLVAGWARGEPRRQVPPEEDWPSCGGTWQEELARLEAAQRELLQAVASLDEAGLARCVGESDLATALEGLVLHDLYHAGQVALLRRALGNPLAA